MVADRRVKGTLAEDDRAVPAEDSWICSGAAGDVRYHRRGSKYVVLEAVPEEESRVAPKAYWRAAKQPVQCKAKLQPRS